MALCNHSLSFPRADVFLSQWGTGKGTLNTVVLSHFPRDTSLEIRVKSSGHRQLPLRKAESLGRLLEQELSLGPLHLR